MTAEVGVLNTLGVALAADSAVSIGPNADKIYSSSDKLFNLALSAPVAIMINGSAGLLGVPWETIVKVYRSRLGTKRFPTIREYADDFFLFLQRDRDMFPISVQEKFAVVTAQLLLEDVRSSLERVFDKEAEQQDGLDQKDLPPIIDKVVKERLEVVLDHDRLAGFGPKTIKSIRGKYTRKIGDLKKKVFGNLNLLPSTQRALTRLVIEMYTREYFSPFRTGVVIAGFGEEEYMPRLFSFDVESMIENKIRKSLSHTCEVSVDNSAAVVPFAQQEMVHAFMNGIDPDLDENMRNSTSAVFEGMVDKIIDTIGATDPSSANALRRQVGPSLDSLLERLFGFWDSEKSKFWGPIVKIASSLPKDELGAMAEALVNLTKFRRRISQDRETVGGPIDVAVITKCDGFVWVKRKHYFDPALNPRIIGKYGMGR